MQSKMIRRRAILALASSSAPFLPGTPASAESATALIGALAALEAAHGGRLGVSILDSGSGRRIAHRGDERFAMCSTFKLLAAGLVLARVDRGRDRLDRQVVYGREDLVSYSPETQNHVGEPGLSLGELCRAALTLSDNTAGNLLLQSFGGPSALTRFARTIGDGISRLDRTETALNEATPGDPRDTTTPRAMANNLRKLVLGDVLSKLSSEQLARWMVANTTGDTRLRAGIPKSWRVADKTGAGDHGALADIAVLWPPDRAPIVVAAYYAQSPAADDVRFAVFAEIGRLAVQAFG